MVKKALFFFVLFLWACFIPEKTFAVESNIQLVYFFSTECTYCERATPVVSTLSRDYQVQGFLYGDEKPGVLPFPVKKGTDKDGDQYGVAGVPVLVVLMDGKTKQVLTGDSDIRDARAFLSAFKKGALTVSEVIEKGPRKTYNVIGWAMSRGENFKNAGMVLTDRKHTISVKPWLPFEAIMSRFKKTRPRLMSDVINKPVLLEGALTKNQEDVEFLVRKEIILE
jgi:thiol-disulfide isomerase/thioredoxin